MSTSENPNFGLPLTVEGLAHALSVLQQQNEEMRRRMDADRQTSQAQMNYRHALIPKPPAPVKYKGERDEESFERWAFSVKEFVAKSERRSPAPFTDIVRVQIASDYLAGDAAGWYERKVSEAQRSNAEPFLSLDELVEGLRGTYVPHISGFILYEKFMAFTQKDMTIPVFVDQYLRYVTRIGDHVSQDWLRYLFVTKVNGKRHPRMVEILRSRLHDYESLEEMTTQAMLLADDPKMEGAAKGPSNAANADAMQIDAVRATSSSSNKRKSVTGAPEYGSPEYKKRYKDSVCFECKKKGHLGRDCWERKRKQQDAKDDKGKGKA
jgi:hypothetical protein